MGFGKKKRLVREAIAKWDCFGYLGYGQGRAVAQFGEKDLHGRSACLDICSRASACRSQHHDKMNERYPQLGQLVESTSRIAQMRGLDVVSEVVSAMTHAVDLGLDEANDVKRILGLFKVKGGMTDHYRCGQFENIQDGLNKVKPGARSALAEADKKAS
jgi:hypothetical protein